MHTLESTEIEQHISIQKYDGKGWKSLYSTGDMATPIYPASISKIFVGAEVLRQIESGNISFKQIVTVKDNNVANFLESEFPYSTFPILKINDSVNVDHLLFLMLSRSDDTATNELIDLVTRESINTYTVKALGMHGTEITRKYCIRAKEDEKYKEAPIIMTVPRHVEIFFQKLHTNEIHSEFVSMKLKEYMAKETGKEHIAFLNVHYPCVYKGGYFSSIIWDKRKCVRRHYAITILVKGEAYSFIVFTLSKSYEDVTKIIEENLSKIFNQYLIGN